MKIAMIMAVATIGAAFVVPVQADIVVAQVDQGCFRNTQTGFYKSISKGDIVPDKARWKLVHSGKCTKCEGKNVLDCQEPGDSEAQGLSHKR
jgi:hypothetical protein